MKTKQYMIMIHDRNKTFIPTPCILNLEKELKGSKIWNDLPNYLKGIASPCSFKWKLK